MVRILHSARDIVVRHCNNGKSRRKPKNSKGKAQ